MDINRYPDISHFAKINVSDFAKQNFTYAFHVSLPSGVVGKDWTSFASLTGVGDPNSPPYDLIYNSGKGFLTCLIPTVQNISVSRPASVQVIPTLGGGKHLEDRGRTREQINIAGTSGYLAAQNLPDSDPYAVKQIFKQELKNVSDRVTEVWEGNAQKLQRLGKRSGYAWFHKLALLFEIYWNVKRVEKPEVAKEAKMVWYNQRDDQMVVVAPDRKSVV